MQAHYFLFYTTERQHQSLDYQTPQEAYEDQKAGGIRTLCAAWSNLTGTKPKQIGSCRNVGKKL